MLIVTLFNCSGIQPTSHSTMDETPTVTPADIVARVRGNNQHDMAATASTSQTATSADEEDNSASDNTPSHLMRQPLNEWRQLSRRAVYPWILS